MDVSEDKTCSFEIAIVRSIEHRLANNPHIPTGIRLKSRFYDAVIGTGYTYVQLRNEAGEGTYYFYDQKDKSQETHLNKIFGALGAGALASHGLKALDMPLPWYVTLPAGLFATFGLPFIASFTGKGEVVRAKNKREPNMVLKAPITREHYTQMREELNALVNEPHHGIYSGPFNNCATFAVKFANDHGFRIDRPLYCTPRTLHIHLQNNPPESLRTMELTG